MVGVLGRIVELQRGFARVLRLRFFVGLLVISCLYIGSWATISLIAKHRRQADFFANTSRSWVEVGAWRFETREFEWFMGTFYHPLVLVVLGTPLALAALLGVLTFIGLAVGAIANRRDRRAAALERREAMKFDLEKRRIEAEKVRPILIGSVADGKSGVEAKAGLLVECEYCRTRFEMTAGECPSCGKPAGGGA